MGEMRQFREMLDNLTPESLEAARRLLRRFVLAEETGRISPLDGDLPEIVPNSREADRP